MYMVFAMVESLTNLKISFIHAHMFIGPTWSIHHTQNNPNQSIEGAIPNHPKKNTLSKSCHVLLIIVFTWNHSKNLFNNAPC